MSWLSRNDVWLLQHSSIVGETLDTANPGERPLKLAYPAKCKSGAYSMLKSLSVDCSQGGPVLTNGGKDTTKLPSLTFPATAIFANCGNYASMMHF